MTSSPIFICGESRSGKTLVRWALTSHSRLAVSRRTEMWPRYFGRYGDLSDARNLERCLDEMLRRKQIIAMGLHRDSLQVALPPSGLGYARLFALMHEQFAHRHGKVRWGDQSAALDSFAGEIIASYPGARIIHMVRDPRDIVEAQNVRGVRRPGWLARTVSAWCSSAARAVANQRRFDDAYMVLRYEALASAPERTLREVCDFVGERYEPSMARLDAAARYEEQRIASPDGIPIVAGHIGRHRGRVPVHELAYIQGRAGPQLEAFDYDLESLRLSSAELVRYAAAWPVKTAATWRRRGDRAQPAVAS